MIVARKVRPPAVKEAKTRKGKETPAKRIVDVSGKETSSTYTSTGYVSIPREPWPLDEVFDV